MNPFRAILLFCCFSILSSCTSPPNHTHLAAQVTFQTAQELQEQKNLYFSGRGGSMMGDIQEMDLSLVFD